MKIKNIRFEKEKWQWLAATLIATLLFGLTYLTGTIRFSTNDDIRIMYALAGYNTGTTYPYQPFINYFLGQVISWQYEFFPQIPWYALFHIFCLYFGTVVIGKCCIKITAKRNIHIGVAVFAIISLYYTVLIFPVMSMQFSTTPAVIGIAAVSLVYTLDAEKDSRHSIYFELGLSVVMLLLCYMTRSFTWYCVMCFYALAVFYQIITTLSKKSINLKKYICILCGCTLFTIILVISFRTLSLEIKDSVEVNNEFEEYNQYRAQVQDYGKRLDYYENSEFYNSLGWTENTYRALLSLLFFDENMNAENLKSIYDAYELNSTNRNMRDIYVTASSIFDEYRVAKTGIAFIAVVFLLCLFLGIGEKNKWQEKLCAVFTILGYLIMFLFLSYQGRLPIRTFMVITICAAVYLVISLLNIAHKRPRFIVRIGRNIAACLIVFLMLYNIRAVYFMDDCTKTQTDTTATEQEVKEFEQYAIAHHENLYVYDFTVATLQRDPFVTFPDIKPTNCIISGGSYTFSTIYYQQLEQNGMSSLYWEDLLKDNVYYVSANWSFVELVMNSISEKVEKQVLCEEIYAFGPEGAKVYKLSVAD